MSEEIQRDPIHWEPLAAIVCFVAAALSLAIGFVFTTGWLLDAGLHPILHGVGLILLIVGLPMIVLGGHCMDLQEKKLSASKNAQRTVIGLVALLSFLCIHARTSVIQAQQTIFNVPTTDVLDRGKIYLELDASLKPGNDSDVKRFSSFVPRVVVGVGSNVEMGLNLAGNIQPGPDSTTLVPTIKWKALQKENGWTLVIGNNLFIPVRNRAYDVGNYFYTEISKAFKSGTRLTFGGYDFTRDVVAAANRAGGQFGFEQSLNKKVTFAADWYTGKHASGYFTPGIIFKVGPRATGYAGYSLGNQNLSGGNHFFLLELGYNVN